MWMNFLLMVCDNFDSGTFVENLTEETITDWNHFVELISFCESKKGLKPDT
jgi:centromeric protein E